MLQAAADIVRARGKRGARCVRGTRRQEKWGVAAGVLKRPLHSSDSARAPVQLFLSIARPARAHPSPLHPPTHPACVLLPLGELPRRQTGVLTPCNARHRAWRSQEMGAKERAPLARIDAAPRPPRPSQPAHPTLVAKLKTCRYAQGRASGAPRSGRVHKRRTRAPCRTSKNAVRGPRSRTPRVQLSFVTPPASHALKPASTPKTHPGGCFIISPTCLVRQTGNPVPGSQEQRHHCFCFSSQTDARPFRPLGPCTPPSRPAPPSPPADLGRPSCGARHGHLLDADGR